MKLYLNFIFVNTVNATGVPVIKSASLVFRKFCFLEKLLV